MTDEQLAFHGFILVDEDNEFKVYRQYGGLPHVVKKQDPYLYVEDWNDALAMSPDRIVSI